jgi:hypothetical protein
MTIKKLYMINSTFVHYSGSSWTMVSPTQGPPAKSVKFYPNSNCENIDSTCLKHLGKPHIIILIAISGEKHGYDNITMSCNADINDQIYDVSCQIMTMITKIILNKSMVRVNLVNQQLLI